MTQSARTSTTSKLLCASALALLGTVVPLSAQACGSEPYIGEVCTFAFNYCPQGFLPADGSLVQINQYQPLYALLSTTFGGDGRSTFGLPDLRGRVVVGTGAVPGQSPIVWGQKDGGSATLTANNLPAHTHPATVAAESLSASASLAVSGGTVSGQTVSGSVTVNGLNGDSPPSGGVAIPTGSANTIGKVGAGFPAFYPPGSNKIALPTTTDLTVSGGMISGATAGGTVKLPAVASTTAVAVGPNATANTPVTVTPARLGLTVCIASTGIWPSRP